MTALAWFLSGVGAGWLMWLVAIWVTRPCVVVLQPSRRGQAAVQALLEQDERLASTRVQ